MLCFRCRTYCISKNCQNKCGRKLTQEIKDAAAEWWGKPGAPISVSTFCGNDGKRIDEEEL